MKKLQFLAIALIFAATVLTSCKEDEKPGPYKTTSSNKSSSMTEFFTNNGARKQSFTVNTSSGVTTVTGTNGSKVYFPSNAFVNSAGQPVSGQVNIDLVEILDKETMLLSDRSTTSNGEVLVSGGQIYINATLNGDTLKLKPNTSILVTMPGTVDPSMTLFTGGGTGSNFNWTVLSNIVNNPSTTPPTVDSSWSNNANGVFYTNAARYTFTVSNLGWINIDRFYGMPANTLKVVCTGAVVPAVRRCYTVFKNMNSVADMGAPRDFGFENAHIPEGEEVSVVVIGIDDTGSQYIGIKAITVAANMSINIELEEASEIQIIQKIKDAI